MGASFAKQPIKVYIELSINWLLVSEVCVIFTIVVPLFDPCCGKSVIIEIQKYRVSVILDKCAFSIYLFIFYTKAVFESVDVIVATKRMLFEISRDYSVLTGSYRQYLLTS